MSRRSDQADDRAEDWWDSWDSWWNRSLAFLPWVLLAASTAVVLLQPWKTWTEHAITIGLALAAAAWVLLGHVLVLNRLLSSGDALARGLAPVLVYFVGLIALCAVMMAYDPLFLIFGTTPFFHVTLLPWPLAFLGVAATSTAMHTSTMGLPGTNPDLPFLQHLVLYVGVIAVQTAGIGGGILAGQKAYEQYQERQEMVAKLEATLEENAGLHAQLLTQAREAGVLDERHRMAREIHDTLGQGLTGIVTQIQAAQRVWEVPEAARPHVDRALSLARESLSEARRSVQALRPVQLEESQLPEALEELTRRWSEGSGIHPDLEVTGERVALSPAIEVALFRVAQEALTNIGKHAEAGRVGVTLSYLEDVVLLDVRDDGRGMAVQNGYGFGLKSMRQRIRGIGGTVEIESGEGDGTAVSATVPAIPVGAS